MNVQNCENIDFSKYKISMFLMGKNYLFDSNKSSGFDISFGIPMQYR